MQSLTITGAIIVSSVFLAGEQVGIQGYTWLIMCFGLIFITAYLIIYQAGKSASSPYLANLSHGVGHDQHIPNETHSYAAAQEVHVVELHQEEATSTKDAPYVQPDDFEIIEGIGPKIALLLHNAGISTFRQLAEIDAAMLRELLDGARYQMIDPSSWSQQAQLAAEGKTQELSELQSQLKGGRRI